MNDNKGVYKYGPLGSQNGFQALSEAAERQALAQWKKEEYTGLLKDQLRKAIDLGEVLAQYDSLHCEDLDIMVENCKLIGDPRKDFFEQRSTEIATGIRKYKAF